jgi:hypothetical protein
LVIQQSGATIDDLTTLVRGAWRRIALPFQLPQSVLPTISHEGGPKRDDASPSGLADGGIGHPVAVQTRERLLCGISERRILLKRRLDSLVARAKRREEIRDQLGIVCHVLEAADGFKFAGAVVANFAETRVQVEGKAQCRAPRDAAQESGLPLTLIPANSFSDAPGTRSSAQPSLTRGHATRGNRFNADDREADVGHTLPIHEIVKAALLAGDRQENRFFQPTRRD